MDLTPKAVEMLRATKMAEVAETVPPFVDEELVPDDRSEMRPAQLVEQKLSGMLKGDGVMISQLRMRSLIAGRA